MGIVYDIAGTSTQITAPGALVGTSGSGAGSQSIC